MAAKTMQVMVDEHELSLSNVEKVLYPKTGFTKGAVIDYYVRMAGVILPHLKGRPLTLKRYPNGVEGMFFYEKRCPAHKPEWVKTAKLWSKHNEDYLEYCTIDEAAGLAWTANLASIELHVLLSKMPKPLVPTAMAFDFDPGPPAGRLEAVKVLLMVKDVLDHLGLESFPKTSGGKGMHLYVPLNTVVTFEETKAFAKELAEGLERAHPELVTSNMLKAKRGGKVFMDWSQNDSHKTTVCVYSLRARERPTVSTPVTWEEIAKAVKKKDEGMLVFEAGEVLKRVEKFGDLFEGVLKVKQKLGGKAVKGGARGKGVKRNPK
ncbi:MAG: non-homologous end-joining DNA ligase [Phycisphaerae bacterium]